MEVEYELSKQDFIDIYIYLSKPDKTALFVQRYIFPIFFLPISLFFVAIKFIDVNDFWGFEFICALMLVLWIIFYPKYFKYKLQTPTTFYEDMVNNDKYKEQIGIGKYSVIIDEGGILEKSEKGEKRFVWNKLKKIISSDSHFFIRINLFDGILIPKIAFQNESSKDYFFQFVNKMINEK